MINCIHGLKIISLLLFVIFLFMENNKNDAIDIKIADGASTVNVNNFIKTARKT